MAPIPPAEGAARSCLPTLDPPRRQRLSQRPTGTTPTRSSRSTHALEARQRSHPEKIAENHGLSSCNARSACIVIISPGVTAVAPFTTGSSRPEAAHLVAASPSSSSSSSFSYIVHSPSESYSPLLLLSHPYHIPITSLFFFPSPASRVTVAHTTPPA